jgi:hypothetical protein
VPRRRLDGEADGFEPSKELADVLSHLATSNRRGFMSCWCQSPDAEVVDTIVEPAGQ